MPRNAGTKGTSKRSSKPARKRPGTGKTAYEIVTAQVIEALENGVVPWRQPWTNRGAAFPIRMSNGRPYRGINVFLLLMTAMSRGYRSGWWGSLNQIHERGGRVRDDEFKKSVTVIFWRDRARKADDEDDQDPKDRKPPIMRMYRVWNAEQCEGLPPKYQAPALVEGTLAEHQPAELVVKTYLAREPSLTVEHGGDRAFWNRRTDKIRLPHPEQFRTPGLYYSTKYHELTHSTGAEDRLDRKADDYATDLHVRGEEELIAEMGAAFLAFITGIEDWFEDSTSYIGSWLEDIKGDPAMVIFAAAKAQRAVEYILSGGYQDDEQQDDEQQDQHQDEAA
jgi:antirestriction protein ArdC